MSRGARAKRYNDEPRLNMKKVVAEGKIPGSDTPHTGDDNAHWPVQLFYYKKNDEDAEELEQGLYFKRMNYHYAGIAPEELDPTDIADTTAKNRFNAVDAQFIAMANDETNYPNNDTESHKGFVK